MTLSDEMRASADGALTIHVCGRFGSDAAVDLHRLLTAARSIYRYVPCEWLTGPFAVFTSIDGSPILDAAAICRSPQELGTLMFQTAMIEVRLDGSLYCLVGQYDETLLDPGKTLVYSYRYREHEHLIAGTALPFPNPAGLPSALSPNAFHDLAEALRHFALIRGRSDCESLRPAWRDGRRLAFVNGPEHFMRRALEWFLRDSLRIHRVTVLPEQMVNETEPVDIKVSWTEFSRHALIEIKWLGKSAAMGAEAWSSTYTESRAVQGAIQLRDYLDQHHTRVLDPTSAYLVVFDARRWGLKPTDGILTHERAFRYQFREITYPVEIVERMDFGEPVRVFLEPVT